MRDYATRTIMCSIVFMDIIDYSKKTVAKQLALKGWFNDILSQILEQIPQADRILIDTGDGAALCCTGDPEDALLAAIALRGLLVENSFPDLDLRIGVNLGPIKVVKDINERVNAIGDGINVAQRIMSFSQPNQILVSRSYFEVVSRLADDYAKMFSYQGVHKDKHVREHEVYELGAGQATAPGSGTAADAEPAKPGASGDIAGTGHVAARFDEGLLARIQRALAKQIGPLAKLMVIKAAAKAGDLDELKEMLAENMPDATGRAAVRAEIQALLPDAGGETAEAGDHHDAAGAAAAEPSKAATHAWDPALLAAAEQQLAKYVGPLAKILVKRAAARCRDANALCAELATSIDDVADRDRFVMAMQRAR